MRVVLLILVLVLAPFGAFFLWAWAVKIKQERKIAGTLPSWQDMPMTWLGIAGFACAIANKSFKLRMLRSGLTTKKAKPSAKRKIGSKSVSGL